MNLSFAGCGFLGIYHVGVGSCIREYAPHVLLNHVSGASAGALVGCALLCNCPLGESTSDVLRVVVKARARALGPFHPGFDINKILHDGLSKILPDNAHILCTNRLSISVTRVSDGQNVLLTQFESKEDLIQALLCSCFIPFFSGILPPKFHGVAYMDGGFSDNLPILNDNTVTVSPFSGESDICPQDNYFNFMQINIAKTSIALSPNNLSRFARILFPPPPEVLSKMCQQGFDDALKFLQRNNTISCTRCLAVQSSFLVSEDNQMEEEDEEEVTSEDETMEVPEHEYDDCNDCRNRRQMAVIGGLPEAVVNAIQDSCDELNKGVINWLFRHRPIKLLSLLTVPYVLPIDITIVLLCKLWELIPKLRKEMERSFWSLLNFSKSLVSRLHKERHLYSAKLSCQLAITEYNYANEDQSVTYTSNTPCSPSHRYFRQMSNRSKSLEDVSRKRCFPDVQRKSYAGRSNIYGNNRRKSMVDIRCPERIISTINFGFKVDLAPTLYRNKRKSVMEAFKTLGDENRELNAIDIANKALNWERESLDRQYGELEPQRADTFEHILDVTNKQDALMAYYYLDEDMRVKVTEIFNVTDADTSAVLSNEEREVNSDLQWDSDWGTEICNNTVDSVDSLDLDESSLLYGECSNDSQYIGSCDAENTSIEKNMPSTFSEFNKGLSSGGQEKSVTGEMPLRKSSFLIVNK